MSFQAMTWAVEQELPALQKLVLLMLSNCCNHHTGQCNPSHERLSKECGMGRTSVKDAIRALSEKGLLEVIHRGEDGVSLPNQYKLNTSTWVGRNTTDGESQCDGGVGRQAPTKQESKPGIETTTIVRASRLPKDWIPSDEEIAFCKRSRPDLIVSEVADQFRDYWTAKAGKDAAKTDWFATWRNWVRKQRTTSGIRQMNFHDERAETIAILTGRNRPKEQDERTIDVQATRIL